MMQKNEIYEGTVCGLGTDGEGIINVEGTTAFVPFCLKDESVRFKALKVKGKIAYGKIDSVIKASKDRVKVPCPVFEKCGGCDIQHMSYKLQLDYKRETVQNALKKIGGIDFIVEDTVPCKKQTHYRNKLVLPIGVDRDGQTVLGFYGPHSHRIIPIDDCLIQSEWVKDIISAVKNFSKDSGYSGYDEQTGKGVLRRIIVREIKGKFIIALVVNKAIDADGLVKELEKNFGEFTFVLNINNSKTNLIFGDKWQVLRGKGFYEAEDGGIKYSAGINTFLQVNDGVREKLYARVLSEAEEGAVAVDLYSGGGMLTAMLAKKCGTAYGIEIVAEASRCADELKNANGLQGKMFNICGAVEDEIDKVFAATAGKNRIIICDPPRKGMERSVVREIERVDADKVILISCNPATLARDLGLLTGTLREENGALKKTDLSESKYHIESITPFDMFPQTKHVETLVVLSRK